MFGVFTHAQLDHGGFWDSLSQQLQRGGSEYIERCTSRNKPFSAGNNAVLPAVFSPLPGPAQDVAQVPQLVGVSEEDVKKVSETDDWPVSDTDRVHVPTDPFYACVRSLDVLAPHNSHIV